MIYDITLPLSESLPVYPGDPPVTLQTLASVSDGAPYSLTKIAMGSHSGTHVDAPSHVLAEGSTVDHISTDRLIGPCHAASINCDMEISINHIEELQLPFGTTRLIIRTTGAQGYLTRESAIRLVNRGIKLVGIDSPSVDAPASPDLPVHRALLEADVIIVENLALESIQPGPYWLACLPLKITGCDGAPARAVLADSKTDFVGEMSNG